MKTEFLSALVLLIASVLAIVRSSRRYNKENEHKSDKERRDLTVYEIVLLLLEVMIAVMSCIFMLVIAISLQ